MQMDAVIVAGGASTRFGRDKLFAPLGGEPVITWSVRAFQSCAFVGSVVVVCPAERIEEFREVVGSGGDEAGLIFVAGGARRRDSVEAGLRACSARYVAIHDGARPLIRGELIASVAGAARGRPGAIAALPVTDTIKQVRDGVIVAHPVRELLWAAQTPQVVLRQAWLDAAAAGDDDETDDAAMLSRLGLECAVVEGDAANIKITRPGDLAIAEAYLRERRGSDA